MRRKEYIINIKEEETGNGFLDFSPFLTLQNICFVTFSLNANQKPPLKAAIALIF
jgi:hypothetical protein